MKLIVLQNVQPSPRNFSIVLMIETARECIACPAYLKTMENVARHAYSSALEGGAPINTFFFRMSGEHNYDFATKVCTGGVLALSRMHALHAIIREWSHY